MFDSVTLFVTARLGTGSTITAYFEGASRADLKPRIAEWVGALARAHGSAAIVWVA